MSESRAEAFDKWFDPDDGKNYRYCWHAACEWQERTLKEKLWQDIQQILNGIDDCSPNDDAYWETSVGAQFGKEKLAEIKALLIDK